MDPTPRMIAEWWAALKPLGRQRKPIALDPVTFEPVSTDDSQSQAELARQGFIVCAHRLVESSLWIDCGPCVIRISIQNDGTHVCWIVERDGTSSRRWFMMNERSGTVELPRAQLRIACEGISPDPASEAQLQWESIQRERAENSARVTEQQKAA